MPVRTACGTARSGRTKLTTTPANGEIYEVSLLDHVQIVSGNSAPGSFGFPLDGRDAAAFDELAQVRGHRCDPTTRFSGRPASWWWS